MFINKNTKKIFTLTLVLFCFFTFKSQVSFAQDIHNDFQGTYSGRIISILSEEEYEVGWNDLTTIYKTLEIKLLSGPNEGQIINAETDFPEIGKGDKVFLNHLRDVGGIDRYVITNIDRTNQVYFLLILFCAVIIVFGGLQGIRSLLALGGGLAAILYLLLPAILNGHNPLMVSVLVASTILFLAIFFTHGFHRESFVAYIGTMIAVLITSLLALYAVDSTNLSGFAEDTSVMLNFKTGGTLDFSGLLLGAIIIGILGMLNDIAMTQAAVVSELYDSNKKISRVEVYKRAMRVGREHVGALVNTLVLAYTGTALPLLLLISNRNLSFNMIINMEVFATEIVRTIVGSIGLVLTVPIVTFLASVYLKDYKNRKHHLDLKPASNESYKLTQSSRTKDERKSRKYPK